MPSNVTHQISTHFNQSAVVLKIAVRSSLCLPSLISTTHFLASREKKFHQRPTADFQSTERASVKSEEMSPGNYHLIYSPVQLRYIRSRGPIKTLNYSMVYESR